MADQDTPTRSSNMEKAEGDREPESRYDDTGGAGISNRPLGDEVERQKEVPARGRAEDQEQLVGRHPHHQDPTRLDEERTSDNSTVENGGIGSGVDEDPR